MKLRALIPLALALSPLGAPALGADSSVPTEATSAVKIEEARLRMYDSVEALAMMKADFFAPETYKRAVDARQAADDLVYAKRPGAMEAVRAAQADADATRAEMTKKSKPIIAAARDRVEAVRKDFASPAVRKAAPEMVVEAERTFVKAEKAGEDLAKALPLYEEAIFHFADAAQRELAARVAASPKAPPIPYVDPGACPGECCAYKAWTARKDLVAKSGRGADATTAFKVKAGERVLGVTGVVVTRKPGKVRFLQAANEETLVAKAGDVGLVLTYHGEGFAAVWHNGKVHETSLIEDGPRKNEEQPECEWWVLIQNAEGKLGWVKDSRGEGFDDQYGC